MEKQKPIFKANPDTDILEKLLESRTDGSTIEYKELSSAIGRDVRNGAAYLLSGARKRLERRGIIFGCISRVGLRFIADHEKADLVSDHTHKIHRAAIRGIRRGAVDDITKLDPANRIKHTVGMSRLALVEMSSSNKSEKKLAKLLQNGAKPTAEMLEALKQ
jgi:hypothetical protein